MIRALLVRGMLAGLAGGVLATVFAWFAGEPQIRDAISFEDRHGEAAGQITAATGQHVHDAAEVVVSRGIQETLGLFVALGLFGVAIGGIFALVFAVLYGRIGNLAARPTAALLTGAGFVVVWLVPFLKYPANPPAIGEDDTIESRTAFYLALIAISIIAAIIAIQTGRRLTSRLGTWNAALLAGAVFIMLAGIACAALPGFDETPTDFPAEVLWKFRIASLGTQLIIWAVLGLVFSATASRILDEESARSNATPIAAG